MIHKSILYIGIVLLLSNKPASSQEVKNREIKFLIDTTIAIMKNNSVNSEKVDWEMTKKNALYKATNLSSPYDLGNIMRYLYRCANDFHGAFFYRDSVFKYNRKESSISDVIKNEWKKRSGIKTKMLKHDFGYLRIPSMPGGSKSEFDSLAQSLNDSLCVLLRKRVKGIVVDLRINGGGAMFPMILGLEQILAGENVGSFQMKNGSQWLLKNHSFYLDTAQLASIIPKCSTNAATLPVAILTSNATGSSGEFLIMAFKGRKNTITIGETTAGYVTVNEGFKINDEAFMNLSVGYGKDRKGKAYYQALEPDIPIYSPDKFMDLQNDNKVKVAIKWLRSIKN